LKYGDFIESKKMILMKWFIYEENKNVQKKI
jgi:hypothetical protein